MFYTYRISKAVGKTLHSEYMIFLPSESIFSKSTFWCTRISIKNMFFRMVNLFSQEDVLFFLHYEAVHAVFLLNIRKTHLCSGDVLSFEHKLASHL